MRAVLLALLMAASSPAWAETGIASIYGNGDGYAWKRTASGELMNPELATAAHRTRPLGSTAFVCGPAGCTAVRINDRGPYVNGRIIDLSPAAARAIGCAGLCQVVVQ